MHSFLDRAAGSRPVRQLLVAGVASFALIGSAGTAFAADATPNDHKWVSDTASSNGNKQAKTAEGAEKPPEVEAFAACDVSGNSGVAKGFVDVLVKNPNAEPDAPAAQATTATAAITYDVILYKDDPAKPVKKGTVEVKPGKSEVFSFEDVAAGVFHVRVAHGDVATNVEQELEVDRCAEIKVPVDDALQVFVRCDNNKGHVTIRVFHLFGEKKKSYTVTIDGEPITEEPIDLPDEGATYAILESPEPVDDGSYTVQVKADGVDTSETVKVACAATPPATNPTEPAPQGRPANTGLADTGASVVWLTAAGVVVLGLGGGLVLFGRRRRASR